MKDLCFIDVETTGPRFGYHEIIEIAAIRTSPDGKQALATWTHRLRPDHPKRITPVAQQINGFDPDLWQDAGLSDQRFWAGFVDFAQGCIPVGHNPSFDRAFITLAAAAAGVEDLGMDYHWIGTETLAWPLYRAGHLEKLSLSSLCAYLGVEPEAEVHRALGGARACRRVYLALMELYAPAQVT